MLLLSGGSVSWGRSYLGDEDITVSRNSKEMGAPGNSGARHFVRAVSIFDVPRLLMSGYEKRLARFKPLAKKG